MAVNEEKLVKMLRYVSEYNDFYKNRIKEYGITNPLDITQWPVLTRKELQENRYNMFSDGYKSKYFNQQLRRQSSSGSSGMPVNVYWDYKDWYASNMSLWRKRWQWYGIKPGDKYVMFTLNAFNVKVNGETVYYIKKPENVLSVNVSLIQNEEQYKNLIDIMNDFNPVWLYIQPFVLNKLIQIYKKYDLKKPTALRYIESVGELLSSDLRRRAIEFFDVAFANMYGSEEMNGIAYECPEYHMQVLNDNIYIEVQNNNGISLSGDGEAIITNLNNFAMPLIRYNQCDCIVVDNSQPYSCVNNRNIICHINGRSSDCIALGDKEINSYFLVEILSETNNHYNGIIDFYRYVYKKSQRKIECMINTKKTEWYSNIKKTLEDIFIKQVLPDTDISFEVKLDKEALLYGEKPQILSIVD